MKTTDVVVPFYLDTQASKSILMGGGIGVTPLIAMAHELYAQGRHFALHYSGRSLHSMGYLDDIASCPWSDKVSVHVSDEGSRVDLEYFAVPETTAYENHPFTLRLLASGREFTVPVDKSAAEVLQQNGMQADMKCQDGLCGVCKCALVSGEVEHRDFVLSSAQRKTDIILCQSRAAKENGVVTIDLQATNQI